MQQKIGPYQVHEQIGAGGMGEVYKAYDDRLDRWVAIKRIRSDKDEGEENRERFQREARATARLNHSSIVHLYDIFQDGDSDCIVMEYVEGLTLDSLIRNGPLEPLQAVSLGHEIASGLAEAHAKGIIHRDLKVENIIVTPEGHAKILDFGLARPFFKDELDASLTGKGQLVGTSRAMSPEYVSGEEIDHRSDLFSLGVLLYEAVTSHSPFKAHNTLATLKQVMLHRQTPAHQVNANVPEEISSVIETLLEKEPSDRPQTAREVAEELGRISGRMSSGDIDRPILGSAFTTTPTEIFTSSATSLDLLSRRRWLMMIAAVLAAGVAATYFLTRWWLGGAEDIPVQETAAGLDFHARDRIVLADFQNHTGEPLLDDSIELLFRLGLEQSRYASVLPRTQMQSALTRMQRDADTLVDRAIGIEICQREDARALVIGTIGKIGETYSLGAEIVDPQTGVSTFSTNESARTQNAIVPALERITKAIRLNLGETLTAIEEAHRPLEKVTTGDLEALRSYSRAVSRLFERDYEAAIPLLERALEIDPDFAMARAKLAAASSYLGHDRGKTLEHLNQALLLSDRLTEFEKLYVEGWLARMQGKPDGVVRAWSLMTELYPAEYVGQFNLGMAYWTYFADYEEAAAAFEAATRVATPENRSTSLIQLGYCKIAMGDYDGALSSFEDVSPAERRDALIDLSLVTESYPEAQRLLQEADPSRHSRLRDTLRLAELHTARGRFEEALAQALEARRLAIEAGRVDYQLVSQLGIALAQQRLANNAGFAEALAAANRAAGSLMSASYEQIETAPIQLLARVGKLNARNAKVEDAEKILSWLSPIVSETAIPVWQGYEAMLEGEILAARGRRKEAQERLLEAGGFADSFQIHESLARSYEAEGSLAAAVTEYEWLLEHRGSAYAECRDLCFTRNVFDWTLAQYHLGRLHEIGGDREKAIDHYRGFHERWTEAPTVKEWRSAKAKLSDLLAA